MKRIGTKKLSKKAVTTNLMQELFEAAILAQKHAHAPYSHRYIGASIMMADGRIYSGCNIENASYGGTVCAERVAIWSAISEGAKTPIKEICVISSEMNPWPPCGICRQVIAEFAAPDTLIFAANPNGTVRSWKFSEIFPEAFTPNHLKNGSTKKKK